MEVIMRKDCNALLSQGIFNETMLEKEEEIHLMIREMIDLSEEKIRKEKEINKDDFSLFGVYSAARLFMSKESYNDHVINHILKLKLRVEQGQEIDEHDKLFYKRRFVSEQVVNAWKECMDNGDSGMSMETIGDTGGEFSVILKWVPTDVHDNATKVVSVAHTNLTPVPPIHFKRNEVVEPYTGLQQVFYRNDSTKEASIVITLDGYQPLELVLPVSDDINGSKVPVGTIIASILKWDKFNKYYNNSKDEDNYEKILWVPADGRPVHGSDFSDYSLSSNVPDLRGVFLRGINRLSSHEPHPVEKVQSDPEGIRTPGSFQADQFETHQHSFRYHTAHSCGSRPHPNLERANDGRASATTENVTIGKHGSETRPKNVAVFYYIRVNE